MWTSRTARSTIVRVSVTKNDMEKLEARIETSKFVVEVGRYVRFDVVWLCKGQVMWAVSAQTSMACLVDRHFMFLTKFRILMLLLHDSQ